MKKIIIISLLIILGTGCNKDPLNITPDGRVTLEDVFKDNLKTGAYLNSCYTYIRPYGMSYSVNTMLASFSDEAHDNLDPTQGLSSTDWYNGGLTPSHDPLSQGVNVNYKEWNGIYKVNIFLANIDKANATSSSDRARWKAEAKILRAFYYWELIKMYGGLPVLKEPLGVVFDFSTLTRSTFDECVQFIVKDCEEAIAEQQLPWRITTGESDRSRMTKAVAYAIMSQATLFNASPLWNPTNDPAKWKQAAAVSKKALDELKVNGYTLYPDYQQYFITVPDVGSVTSDKETIFMRKNATGFEGGAAMQVFNSPLHIAGAGSSPSQELVDAYDMKNGQPAIMGYSDADHLQPIINPLSGYDDKDPYKDRDSRFYATVIYNGTFYAFIKRGIQTYVGGVEGISQLSKYYTHTGYYLQKYLDNRLSGAQQDGARWKVYRLAEIYLNLAEAENEANGPGQIAYDAVNGVRARAGMPPLPAGLSKDEFRKRVRNERRVELAFEEKRFWDVRRWKILDQTDKSTSGMEWKKKSDGTFTGTRIVVDRRKSWSDKYLIFPIPLTEMNTLPGFKQNPGW